jgi:hypothetical protein
LATTSSPTTYRIKAQNGVNTRLITTINKKENKGRTKYFKQKNRLNRITKQKLMQQQARPHQPMGREFTAAESRTKLLANSNCVKVEAALSSSPRAAATALELALSNLPFYSSSSKRAGEKLGIL